MKRLLFVLFGLYGMLFVIPAWSANNLPAGYTELEYLEATGTQYINLGTLSNGSVEVTFSPTRLTGDATGTGYDGILGINSAPQLGWFTTGWTIGNAGSTKPYKPEIGKVYTYKWTASDGKSYIDNIPTGLTRTGTLTLKLFWTANNSKPSKCYGYRQYNSDGVLQVNLIPARYDNDGTLGMYDTISGTFFDNDGTGNFIAGPDAIIKIATTKMVDEEFAAAEAKLATTVQTIESVVSRTITQTEQIAALQAEKQTRPDESCPANKKCLLVEDEQGFPHWYEIIE
ncbi:MAG: hypothetical protein MJ164_01610 [Alphaproteobacteria bacterium]|nr:hypothetical protein [Alphaproteobacteria bacterium]